MGFKVKLSGKYVVEIKGLRGVAMATDFRIAIAVNGPQPWYNILFIIL